MKYYQYKYETIRLHQLLKGPLCGNLYRAVRRIIEWDLHGKLLDIEDKLHSILSTNINNKL
jgi:hypothetical protein